MYDVAQILSHYIPLAHWPQWLSYYGYGNLFFLLQEVKEINLLQQALGILDWDTQTGMPEKAVPS